MGKIVLPLGVTPLRHRLRGEHTGVTLEQSDGDYLRVLALVPTLGQDGAQANSPLGEEPMGESDPGGAVIDRGNTVSVIAPGDVGGPVGGFDFM